MLALGARGVLLGRAYIYALAAGGEEGVAKLLDLIAQGMKVTMALSGITSVKDIERSMLV
jgi:L-lactate dehydrogenase (cytochrome)